MKIQYFAETDTLLVTFNDQPVMETRDLDENTVLDLDARGRLVALTLEHARERADVSTMLFEQIGSVVPAEA